MWVDLKIRPHKVSTSRTRGRPASFCRGDILVAYGILSSAEVLTCWCHGCRTYRKHTQNHVRYATNWTPHSCYSDLSLYPQADFLGKNIAAKNSANIRLSRDLRTQENSAEA